MWYQSLSVLEKIYFYIAIVATVLLIVQIVLMCFSIGDDVDIDGDGMIDADGDTGVSVFTLKSLTAFFAVGGWAGLLTAQLLPNLQWVSIIVAIVAGTIAMAAVVLLIKALLKLQCNGAIETEKLVGKTATVYVTIPKQREGRGKITLIAQGKYVEMDAVTDEGESLKVDETVEIVATENECTVVRKI
jgi:membrane protein implicated in regulation of membrane protease activity